jgi:uncharacterized protein (DUF885 family)
VPTWAEIEREVVDSRFRFSPGSGRLVGDHRFDGLMADVSAAAISARLEEIARQLTLLENAAGLGRDQDIDRRSLIAQLRGQQFDLAEKRGPFEDPMYYSGFEVELDVSFYLKRNYAPLEQRLASLRETLLGYRGYLEAARDNLAPSLPKPNLEVSIESAEGQVEYLRGEVAAAAAADPQTLKSVLLAADQMSGFVEFLRQRLPKAHQNYELGEERFLRFLKMRELVDMTTSELRSMVRADVERNTARAREVAERIAPGKGIHEALAELARHHPTRQSIVEDVRKSLEAIRTYILDTDLMTIPSEVRCLVAPTPSYLSFFTAALDSAGPLETVATESYYYVTVPTDAWGEEKSEEWLRHLNYPVLENISIHEAYPGHYVQFLHEKRASSLSRRLFWVQSTGEGYAHYCEQMMLEEGYSDDPKLELAQLMDALLRDCRFLTSLGLHCDGMSMTEAIQIFKKTGFMTELPATREANRGAYDPLYLNYTLGKLLIYQLREKAARRPGYSLKRFHDAFLGCGNLPLPLIGELI